MAPGPATPTLRGSSEDRHHEGSGEGLPMSSPMVCQCENQLAHWDWAGRPHPNLPECCRSTIADAMMATLIPVNDGKILVQQYVNSCTHKGLATDDDKSLNASDFEGNGRGEKNSLRCPRNLT